MRINLLDGSLRVLGGHPHDIDLRLTKAMVAAGHDVHVYCHLDAGSVLQSHYHPYAPITPIFTVNPYSRPESFDTVAGDIIKNLDGGRQTANELLLTRDADRWLWPSLYPHQLLACAITKTRTLTSGCIHHPPGFFSPRDIAWWRYGYILARNAGLNIRVGAMVPEAQPLFSPLTMDGKFLLLPYPNDAPHIIAERLSVKTIGIFGSQRIEKGTLFLRSLLQRLVADGYQVMLHDSNQDEGEYGDIPGVVRLGHVMDLDAEIAKCDLVLAPYHPESYRYRGSGILMSALANGVPVVAPAGSAPGNLIQQTGAGTLFSAYSLDSIYAAVQTALGGYAAIAKSAYIVASQWQEQHGVKKFMDAMIG